MQAQASWRTLSFGLLHSLLPRSSIPSALSTVDGQRCYSKQTRASQPGFTADARASSSGSNSASLVHELKSITHFAVMDTKLTTELLQSCDEG